MYGKLKTHNFFVTTLDAVINDTDVTGTIVIADKTVNGVTLEDGSYIFWMLVGLNSPTELEIFRIVSVSGKTLTYDKRISPNGVMPHSIGDLAQCNDMGELINFIGDNTQMFGYTETINGVGNELKVNVLGGTVMDITMTDIIVPDVILTMVDNSTNYIYLDDYTNTIKTTTVNPVSYYTISTVVTLSGAITSITDTRVVYTGKMGIPLSITEAARDAIVSPRNGCIIFNDTTGTLNRYEGGEWIDFSFGGTANPRLTEVVEGKARYATNAEFAAQSDTGLDGASLVPKVSQVTTSVGFANVTVAGTVEEATSSELGAGTATGGTGARLFIGPMHTKKTSSGASDENKIPVLNSSGKIATGFLPTPVVSAYDAVVALSDGDYTSVSAAIAAGKRRILVKDGTYNNESSWNISGAFSCIIHGEHQGGAIINFAVNGSASVITINEGEIKGLKLNFTFKKGYCANCFSPRADGTGALLIQDCYITGLVSTAGGAYTSDIYLMYGGTRTTFLGCVIDLGGTLTAGYKINLGNETIQFLGCKLTFDVGGGVASGLGGRYYNCTLQQLSLANGTGFQSYFNTCTINLLDSTVVSSGFVWRASLCEIDVPINCTGTFTVGRITGCYIDGNYSSVVCSFMGPASATDFYGFNGGFTIGEDASVSGCYLRTTGDITYSGNGGCISSNRIYCSAGIRFNGQSSTMSGNQIYGGPTVYFGATSLHNVFNGNSCYSSTTISWVTGSTYNNVVGNSRLGFSGTIDNNEETANTNG